MLGDMEEFDPFASDNLSFFQVFASGTKDAEATLGERVGVVFGCDGGLIGAIWDRKAAA